MFFGNADTIRRTVAARGAEPGTNAIVIDAESVPFVDVTAVRMLDEVAAELARTGQRLALAHDRGQVGDMLAAAADQGAVSPWIDAAVAGLILVLQRTRLGTVGLVVAVVAGSALARCASRCRP